MRTLIIHSHGPLPHALQAVEARRSERLWRERMDAFNTALETQKEDTLDITADMLRQYKAMQVQHTADLSASHDEAPNRVLQRADSLRRGEPAAAL